MKGLASYSARLKLEIVAVYMTRTLITIRYRKSRVASGAGITFLFVSRGDTVFIRRNAYPISRESGLILVHLDLQNSRWDIIDRRGDDTEL